MNTPPRLRLEPRPSRIACGSFVAVCVAASILLLALPLPSFATLSGGAAIAVALLSGVRRFGGRGVPALLYVGIDRRIAVTDRTGRTDTGPVLDDTYVGAMLTTIVWRADADPWWRRARVVLVLPDTLPREDFRRLRVALRYGRVAADEETSGVDAA